MTFVPTDITGLQLWHDFSDADTLFTDAGTTKVTADAQAIYQANDKSGNNRHAVQASSTLRPLYKVNVQNSKSTAYFDGSDDVMTLVNLTLTNYSTYLVYKHLTQASGARNIHAWDNYNASPRHAQITGVRSAANDKFTPEIIVGGTGASYISTQHTNGAPYLIDFVRAGAAAAVCRNGTNIHNFTVGTGEFAMVGHRLGTHYYSGANQSQYANAYVCELLIYNSAHSAGDQAAVRYYLATKWDIYAAEAPATGCPVQSMYYMKQRGK